MNVTCQDCRSVFRVDPAKVPPNGVRARCSVCGAIIRISVGAATPLTNPALTPRSHTPLGVPTTGATTPSAIPGIRRPTPALGTQTVPTYGSLAGGMPPGLSPIPPATPAPAVSYPPLPFGRGTPSVMPVVAPVTARETVHDQTGVPEQLPMLSMATPVTPQEAVPNPPTLVGHHAVVEETSEPPAELSSVQAPVEFQTVETHTVETHTVATHTVEMHTLETHTPSAEVSSQDPVVEPQAALAPDVIDAIESPAHAIASPAESPHGAREESVPVLPPVLEPHTPVPPMSVPPAPAVPAPAVVGVQRPLVPPPPPSPGQMIANAPAPVAPAGQPPAPAAPGGDARRVINPFLRSDPMTRARRLARALVSDMVAYQPAKRADGLTNGTLKQLFRDEIRKSYDEYVEQVGRDVAESTAFFQEALNEVLADGQRVF